MALDEDRSIDMPTASQINKGTEGCRMELETSVRIKAVAKALKRTITFCVRYVAKCFDRFKRFPIRSAVCLQPVDCLLRRDGQSHNAWAWWYGSWQFLIIQQPMFTSSEFHT
mmetsp:Transcript_9057/g.17060  ORF Transcript_9057/g.17060 Transcript_9057/m.17060 type:complete len:112 (+) Transcript_9057:633-968(+)